MKTVARLSSFIFTVVRSRLTAKTLLATLALLSTGAAAQVTVAGSVGGVNGTYATLGAAFVAINNVASHTGSNIIVTITGDTNEGAVTATLNQPTGGSWNTLTIKPSGGVTRGIIGTTTASNPLIDFNGADNVTIDGLNTGGNGLLISNTTVSAVVGTATVRFINGATGNTITNSVIVGSGSSSVASDGATIFFSTDSVTGNGNDNNIISNNIIGAATTALPSKAILCNGSVTTGAVGNSGLIIDNNTIVDYFAAATTSAGVAFSNGCSASSITNNKFYQNGNRTWTTGALHAAIFLNSTAAGTGVQGMTITGNIIGYASGTQTGTYTLSGATTTNGSFRGISFNGINGGAVSTISNNTIAAVSLAGVTSSGRSNSAPLMGIFVNNGIANTNGNTIGSQSANGSITYSSSSVSDSDVYAIYNLSNDACTIANNNVGGITAINTGTGAANVYGLRVFTSTTVTAAITSNVVGGSVANSLQSSSAAPNSQVVGILLSLSIATVNQNIVRNLSAAGGTGTSTNASVVGIGFANASTINSASQNTIFNLSNSNTTAATRLTGIQFTGATVGNVVARNLIHSISSASSSAAAEINGIRIANGSTVYRNNMIAVGAGTANAIGAAPTTGGVNGINEIGGTNSFLHNSVYVGGAPTAGTGPSFAFNSAVVTNARSLRNNIFFNARSNSGAAGSHYALRVGGTTPNPAGLTINNNVYFANGSGAVFGFFNALDVANFASWKTAVGQDAASFQSDPQYLDPTNAVPDLHISPSVVTVVEGNGLDVGVTDDFDGQTRASFTPIDIGADAANFLGTDLSAPGIVYTPLANSSLTSSRVLSVAITDVTGVATSGSVPRVYYKKNAGTDVSQACSLASGTAQNGTWNCTINYASVGGVVATDVIGYYVVAQDTLGNLAANPSTGFVGNNVATVTTPPTAPNLYTISPTFSGLFNVGATEAITSLTNAGGLFERINAGVLNGNVVVNLTSDLTAELGTVALNEWPEDGVGNYSLLIKPSGGARTISGTNAGALIRLNGADRVTIDGSTTGATANGVGGNAAIRELTVQNTNVGTAAAVILVGSGSNGAQNNTIRNVNVLGQDPLTTRVGISLGGTTPGAGGADNDNNRIENCSIKRAIIGIYSSGASEANPNTGTVITMNETSSVVGDRIRRVGMAVFNDNGAQITLNSISGVSTSETFDAVGIAVGTFSLDVAIVVTTGGVTNALVARNKIDGIASLNIVGFSAAGIAVAGTAGGTNTIVNNMITGVTAPATSPDLVAGIFVAGVAGSVTRLHHNSIAMTGDRGAVASQSPSYAVAITGADPTVELKNNMFYTTQIASSGGVNAKSYAIGTATTTFANLDSNYNDFFTSGANAGFFRSGSLAPAAGADYATLASWQAATAKDSNSFEVDPAFVNPINDLHLPATSPLRGAGIAGFATVDFDNDPRPLVSPEIGADQLVSDLTISKAHVGASFTQGQNGAQYTLTVANGSTVVTRGTITVTDTLPAGLTFASGSSTGWSCSALLREVTCTNTANPIAGGGNSVITLNVNVANNAAASLQNSATVACICAESNTANNTSNVDTVNVVQLPDLTINKAHVGANFAQGQNGAQYSLTVANGGSAATTGTLTVTDTLPAGLTFASGSGTGWSCSALLQLVTCTNPATPIAGGGNSLITLNVNVATNAAASLQNSASVACTCTEINTGNNTSNIDTVSVSNAPLPDFIVTKTHTGNFALGQVGANYTVTVSNTGVGSKPAASLVTLIDTPPVGLTLTAMSGAGWSCTLPSCTRTDVLANGQSYPPITVTVTVLGSATSPQINAVTVSTAAIESFTSNNSATDSTLIVAGTPGSLSVSKSGSGTGTIASLDGGISCGATCTSAYVNTSIVTLSATPTGGSVFTGWLGACIGTATCVVTINGASAVSATFAAAPVGTRILDINNDNQYLPESDGVLVVRYLFGLRGTALTNGLTLAGTRTDPTPIETYLRDILPYLDVDGNGAVDALTDGLLIMRQLLTPSGPLLIQNALGIGARRATAIDVNIHILTLRP